MIDKKQLTGAEVALRFEEREGKLVRIYGQEVAVPAVAIDVNVVFPEVQMGGSPPSTRLMSLLSISYETFGQTVLLDFEVEAIANVLPDDLQQMAVEWFRHSMTTNDPPPEILDIQDHIYRLVEGHERCFEILKQGVRRWSSIWPLIHDPGRSKRILRQLLLCNVESCGAIQLIEALRVARPSFDGLHVQRTTPWFEHDNLHASVFAWLGRQKSTAPSQPPDFDSRLVPLLAILVEEMIGTALQMELFLSGDDLERAKWEELAAASNGACAVLFEIGAEWRGVPFANLFLAKICGRYQLLRERQMFRLNRVKPSLEHYDRVVEACCAVEAASQLRWPGPRFVRWLNLPVPAERVERFMRLWGAVEPNIGSTLMPEDRYWCMGDTD